MMNRSLLNIKKTLKVDSGFTIVELVIYMGLFSILLVVMTQMFISTLKVQLSAESTSNVEQDSRFILARMMYDIQNASDIVIPATLGAAPGNTLHIRVSGNDYTFTLSGADLILDVNGTPNKLNGHDTRITNLSFQRLGNPGVDNSIKIGFTVISLVNLSSGPELKNVNTVIGLRPNL